MTAEDAKALDSGFRRNDEKQSAGGMSC